MKKILLAVALFFWFVAPASANSTYPTNTYCYNGTCGYTNPLTGCQTVGAANGLPNITAPWNATYSRYDCLSNGGWFAAMTINGTPSCASGYTYNSATGMCDQNVVCPASGATDGYYQQQAFYSSGNACVNGCQYNMSNVVCTSTSSGTTCAGTVGTSKGTACPAGTPNSQTSPTIASCTASGQGYITDGVDVVCVPAGNSSAVNSAVTQANTIAGAAAGGASGVTPSQSGAIAGAAGAAGAAAAATGQVPGVVIAISPNNQIADWCAMNPTSAMCVPPVSGVTVSMPSDYAKSGEAMAAANAVDATLNNYLGQQVAVPPGAASAPFDATSLNSVQSQQAADQNGFSSLWSWTPPGQTACQPITGRVGFVSVSWDFCPTITILRDILAWLLAVFTLWDVYRIVTTREV